MRQGEVKDLASLGYVEMLDALEKAQSSLADDRILRRALNLTVVDVVLRKKLLRALAALSSGAVIPPVERPAGWRHGCILCGQTSVMLVTLVFGPLGSSRPGATEGTY